MTIGRAGGVGGSEEARTGPGSSAATRRLFIAVPLPLDVQGRVGELIDRVRARADAAPGDRGGADPRWIRAESLHLTLRFLGDTPEGRVADLRAALATVAASSTAFDVALTGSGAFPDSSSPRAMWLGIGRGRDELVHLAASVDAALAQRGWPSDGRPFRAHLTIARAEDPGRGRVALRALDPEARELDAAWRVESVVVFESLLGRGPARYTALAESRLGR
jgi:RNA 2',3'-cyclic 3'-phosphodiesterase